MTIINLRYLQNTLEQLMLFIPKVRWRSHFFYCTNGSSMRAVVATTMPWIVAPAAIWIDYRHGCTIARLGRLA